MPIIAEDIIDMIRSLEQFKALLIDIGINIYSILVIIITVIGELLENLPSWLAIILIILLVASVIFMNVARGIAYLRKRKSKKEK